MSRNILTRLPESLASPTGILVGRSSRMTRQIPINGVSHLRRWNSSGTTGGLLSNLARSTVHKVAISGFGEGTNDLYDRARPSYPPDALHKIHQTISRFSGGERWKIIEPGSGTGIFTRLLLSPPPASNGGAPSGYPNFPIDTLVSIEPSQGMRKTWSNGLHSKIPQKALEGKTVQVVEGAFDDFHKVEEYGLKKGEVDGVVVAQAWHWCDDHEGALREISSYLRPSAPLILIWNLESRQPHWQGEIRDSYEPYDLGSPQYYKGLWRKMFETQAYMELFEEKEEWITTWGTGISEDELIDRLFSKSYLTSAHLSPADREKLETQIRGIVRDAQHDWVDKDKGIFQYKYDTDIVILRRKA
ncbi:hypothetical protein I302_103338 [Kwoniella bestiolae CBS 10118]|uniref:Methyltransferase type 11 domain-containing protein n=1 Tax=Kwoniella bestiolae CBS 10118 TaxID=1296100 RepID=A0A1B9G858_9TREE|nr:hypothetical protein I302_02040 [Kwoniella bestiolae CBS 10118]OCF27202.1 hypothetical protein I302_02040 [Kwoniella bestiolae CBS 10118]